MFKFLLYQLGKFLVNRMSLASAYTLARHISDIQYTFSPRDRRAVRNNLRIITASDQDLDKLTREVFCNFGKYLVEFFRMEKTVNLDYIKKNITIENEKYIQEIKKTPFVDRVYRPPRRHAITDSV